MLLIDRNNYHTFTPLLYQVATCGLDPGVVAYPVRSIFADAPNVHFLPGDVQGIDTNGKSAQKQLQSLGVEVRTGAFVDEVGADYVRMNDGSTINTSTIVWSAGVKGNPLAEMLNVELERGNRIPVKETMEVIGLENVFSAGDIAYLIEAKSGQAYPGLIPVAQQQGVIVAKNILHDLKGEG